MGLVQARTTTDPTFDQIEDIATVHADRGLMAIANALKAEGLDAEQDQDFKLKDVKFMSGVLVIEETNGNKYFMGKPEKFDIGPDEDVREIGEYVLGAME